MNLDDVRNICDVVNKATLRAHRRYLRAAQYAAMAIPESYVQSESFISLSRKYGRIYDIIMEPRLIQIGFDGIGNTDLVIGDFYEPDEPKVDCVVEFKRLTHYKSISADLERLRSILEQDGAPYCIISAYTSRSNGENIENFIEYVKNRNGITETDHRYNYECVRSENVETIRRPQRRNGTLISGNSGCFSNICIAMRSRP